LSADRFAIEPRPGPKPLDGFDKLTAGTLGALSLSKRVRPYSQLSERRFHLWSASHLHDPGQEPVSKRVLA
jgi:hypothetical protein